MARGLLLDLAARLDNLPSSLLGQSVELFAADRLAVDERDRDHAGHARLQRDVTLGGELLQLAFETLVLAGDFTEDLALPLVVLFAFECPGDLTSHRLEESLHVVREGRATAGRQRGRVRTVRVAEVVDVDPV